MLSATDVTTAARSRERKAGVRVTEGVIRQVERKGAGQACIACRGSETLELYRGDIAVTLDGATYRITKTDSHACWATKQGENIADYIALYNILETTPNKIRGAVEPVA